MANDYRPNYYALYPNTEINAEILNVLRKSDRKMKYMEQEIKIERPAKAKPGTNPRTLPAREESYDRLLEARREFADGEAKPEEQLLESVNLALLYECLDQLDETERALIQHLFYNGMTVRDAALIIGVSHVAVHKRKQKILKKLKKMLKS